MRGLKKKHNFCDMLSRDYNALYDFLILLIITLSDWREKMRLRMCLSRNYSRAVAHMSIWAYVAVFKKPFYYFILQFSWCLRRSPPQRIGYTTSPGSRWSAVVCTRRHKWSSFQSREILTWPPQGATTWSKQLYQEGKRKPPKQSSMRWKQKH